MARASFCRHRGANISQSALCDGVDVDGPPVPSRTVLLAWVWLFEASDASQLEKRSIYPRTRRATLIAHHTAVTTCLPVVQLWGATPRLAVYGERGEEYAKFSTGFPTRRSQLFSSQVPPRLKCVEENTHGSRYI